jgi:RNA polymerase sigma factor (sigma-70 family)
MNPISPYQVGHPEQPVPREVRRKHFAYVYNRYYRKINGICRRYSSKADSAEDLTHDVFVQYFLNFENFRNESSPSTWMYRVAINLGIQRWRKDRTRSLDDMELESIPAGTQDNERALLDKIALKKILDRCPERTRKILVLFHYERMTQVEIGELLGISRATVTRHLKIQPF